MPDCFTKTVSGESWRRQADETVVVPTSQLDTSLCQFDEQVTDTDVPGTSTVVADARSLKFLLCDVGSFSPGSLVSFADVLGCGRGNVGAGSVGLVSLSDVAVGAPGDARALVCISHVSSGVWCRSQTCPVEGVYTPAQMLFVSCRALTWRGARIFHGTLSRGAATQPDSPDMSRANFGLPRCRER